ncbi:MAG TPA: hypothetical protein VD788_00230, partial [Candidatus Polarisedimenticolaceae bacterium]|nr:hypothetical protein [Candidatus Polarisedimenticolaceae bacterium]
MSRSFRWNGSSSGGVVLSVTALVAISAVALAVDGQLARSGPPAVSLAVGAVICARLADRLAAEGAIRLALAFVLASLVALPPMASVAVAGLAGVAGRGRGVGLSGGDRPRALVSLVVGVATTEVLGLGLGGRLPREAWGGLPWLVVGFVVLHLVDRATPGAEPQRRLARRSRWLLASCNLPLAWFLVRIHFEFHWAEALIVVAVVTGFQAALARL